MENDTLRTQNTGKNNYGDDKKLSELEEINRELENDLQDNQKYYEAKIADLEANIIDMTKYYEKQSNSSQNNKGMDNLKRENKRLTNLVEELKKKTPKENKDTTKQLEELKK